ncbi:MAG: hypothetical protein M1838_005760 [Thelocarpon superellum]|nr:MAG: hypothetical protein M1838_005760 [Thelocarpon superellum]
MATSAFRLNETLFNPILYSRINQIWFSGVPEDATVPPNDVEKRWYGLSGPAAREAFDEECRQSFGSVLQSIGPDALVLPPFTSHEVERDNAAGLAAPFLSQIISAEANGTASETTAKTAMAMFILLDQLPRNIFRGPAASQVFSHYDRLSLALSLCIVDEHLMPKIGDKDPGLALGLARRLDLHPSVRFRPVYRQWFYLPLEHSECRSYHVLLQQLTSSSMLPDVEAQGDAAAVTAVHHFMDFEAQHRKIIDQFGRYPHRNDPLGRQWTPEEKTFIEGGGQTFGS